MRNRTVGFLIIGIALLIGVITLLFNRALLDITSSLCSMGPACPMVQSIDSQTNISLTMMAFVILLGLYLIFFAKDEEETKYRIKKQQKQSSAQFEQKKITKENYKKILNNVEPDEKLALERIIDAEGMVFQSELVERLGLSKVKVTRILDKLEGKGLIERKRRGMTNVVILKH